MEAVKVVSIAEGLEAERVLSQRNNLSLCSLALRAGFIRFRQCLQDWGWCPLPKQKRQRSWLSEKGNFRVHETHLLNGPDGNINQGARNLKQLTKLQEETGSRGRKSVWI